MNPLSRREWILGTGGLFLPFGFGTIAGCQSQPKTPLAHLYGEKWVHGAYELYSGQYGAVRDTAEQDSFDAYKVIAQKGIVALDSLQSRGTAFFIKVDSKADKFSIERNIPERLTYTADMSDSDRKAAKENWEKAREHLHTDYEEIRRLNWSLTTLLKKLQAVRNGIETSQIEQYRMVVQVATLREGGKPPFDLPFQVTSQDYQDICILLLERLEDVKIRMRAVEAAIVSVGLVTRATDANSGSLAANLNRVLVAVVKDAEAATPRPNAYPQTGEKDDVQSKGAKLYDEIKGSEDFKKWEKAEKAKAFEGLGTVFSVFEQMTGLPTSRVYKQVLDIWMGDQDYLNYLKIAASLVPGGGKLVKVVESGLELTQKARDAQKMLKGGITQAALAELQKKGAPMMNATEYGLKRADKQLALLKSPDEAKQTAQELAETKLMKSDLPSGAK